MHWSLILEVRAKLKPNITGFLYDNSSIQCWVRINLYFLIQH